MALKRIDNLGRSGQSVTGPLSKVLYVEDEDTNWNVTELHLRGKYNLKRARDSAETFKLLSEERFDLILLDIQLSGSEYDGIEICKILKRRPCQYIPAPAATLGCEKVPVVFVTAYSARYTKDELLNKAGADDVVTKPVDFTRLRLLTARLTVRDIV